MRQYKVPIRHVLILSAKLILHADKKGWDSTLKNTGTLESIEGLQQTTKLSQ